MNVEEIKEYVKKRDSILMDMDVEAMRSLCDENGVPKSMTGGESFLAGMHKARLEVVTMPEEKKEESKRWLMVNGYHKMIED